MLKPFFIFALVCLEFSASIRSRRYYSWYSDFKCQDNETYLENYCNTCWCQNGKLTDCTDMRCSGEDYYFAKYCNVGEIWTEDCNDCVCTKERGTVCTVRECPNTKRPEEGDEEVPTTIEFIPTPPSLNTSGTCPECPSCPPCECPSCSEEPPATTTGYNPECTYPPDDDNYDYYGDHAGRWFLGSYNG